MRIGTSVAICVWATASATAQSACPNELCRMIVSGKLSDLSSPKFTAQRDQVMRVYEASGFRPVWLDHGAATSRARSPAPSATQIKKD